MPEEKLVGKVTHIYDKIGVAIIKLTAPLAVGQTARLRGAHDDFTQTISDMQYEHQAISQGSKG
jgi:hypothetical protein